MFNVWFQSILLVTSVGASRPSASYTTRADSAYEDFQRQHGARDFAQDHLGYQARLRLFLQRQAQIEAQNARKVSSWTAGLNRFADWTEAELRTLGNYRRTGHNLEARSVPSFLELQPNRSVAIPESINWLDHLPISIGYNRSQGACGSCWAVATAQVLEMHAELAHGFTHKVSFEQLVDCTPNQKHCGGNGGCGGATPELAMKYVSEQGLDFEDHYTGYLHSRHPSEFKGTTTGKCKPHTSNQRLMIGGFVNLRINRNHDLLEAVGTKGPATVAVDSHGFGIYKGGVFDDCSRDAVVDHSVVCVGYGHDLISGKDYWLLRNSWGTQWGENGLIRLQRFHGEEEYCGTDHNPKEGTACDNGPSEVPVCGMCGVLSDSSYPTSARIVTDDAEHVEERVDIHREQVEQHGSSGTKVVIHEEQVVIFRQGAMARAK